MLESMDHAVTDYIIDETTFDDVIDEAQFELMKDMHNNNNNNNNNTNVQLVVNIFFFFWIFTKPLIQLMGPTEMLYANRKSFIKFKKMALTMAIALSH